MQPSYSASTGSTSGAVPALWQIDETKRPTDAAKFLDAITFLKEHPEWVQTNQKEAKERFSLLAATDLSTIETELSNKACDIQVYLIKAYPALFPITTIKLKMISKNGDVVAEIEIPENRLTEKSEKFKRELQSGLKEQNNREIELLAPQGIDQEICKKACEAFLSYLKTGKVDLTGDNALPLLNLASEHSLSNLSKTCCDFLLENLELSAVKPVLEHAIQLHLDDLKWVCLMIAYRDCQTEEFQALLKSFQQEPLTEAEQLNLPETEQLDLNEEELAEAMLLLDSAKKCKDYTITPSFEKNARTISLAKLPVNVNQQAVLEGLCPLIQGLRIIHKETNDNHLEELAKILNNINYLFIRSDKIETIPQSWLAKLKEIDCYGCNP